VDEYGDVDPHPSIYHDPVHGILDSHKLLCTMRPCGSLARNDECLYRSVRLRGKHGYKEDRTPPTGNKNRFYYVN